MPLIYYGDPILRRRAQEVAAINQEIHQLIAELKEVMVTHNGCGIAAPMVGAPWRVMVVRCDQFASDGSVSIGETLALINPRFSNPSKETWMMEEGNLSIPGIQVPVERPQEITIDALDPSGDPVHLEVAGLTARIAMHENDVLNGVMMIDRAPKKMREQAKQALKRISFPGRSAQ